MKIRELIEATGAEIIKPVDLDKEVKISTDTRTISEGDFYLPLKGANFDGEKFISKGKNTPFTGTEVYGRIAYTIVDGQIKYAAGR